MTRRIFNAMLGVTLVAVALCMFFLTAILLPHYESRISTELQVELDYLAQMVEDFGIESLNDFHFDKNRITLIQPDGTVTFDSSVDPATLDNHGNRDEVKQALATGKGKSSRSSDTLRDKTLYHALRLSDGSVLRIGSTQYSDMGMVFLLIQPIVLILALVALLSAIISYWVAVRLTKPLNAINLEHPQISKEYEELAPLLRRLNHQNRQIKAQMLELSQQQQRFASITDHMKEGFLVLDAKGRVLSYNTSTSQLLHATHDLTGQNMTKWPIQELAKAVKDALEGHHNETVIPLYGRMCQLFANPVYHQESLTGTVIVLLDVTEKHERETLRREFSANVSHELKTPLTSISGIAEIMKSGLVDSQDVASFAGKIYDESQRLIHLVGDIINLSQLDENSIPYTPAPVDLTMLAKTIALSLDTTAQKQNVQLSVEGEPVVISGVRPVLEEMLFNLCENAIKYNKPGGHVWVSCKNSPTGPIVEVKDDGIGIPAEDHDRVFERFYRVDKSHSKAIGGTGLGLSIVKHSAAYHHARIELNSTPGEGTCIRLYFPASSHLPVSALGTQANQLTLG